MDSRGAPFLDITKKKRKFLTRPMQISLANLSSRIFHQLSLAVAAPIYKLLQIQVVVGGPVVTVHATQTLSHVQTMTLGDQGTLLSVLGKNFKP